MKLSIRNVLPSLKVPFFTVFYPLRGMEEGVMV